MNSKIHSQSSKQDDTLASAAMRFEYEITPDDYVSSQILYWKITKQGKPLSKPLTWALLGVGLIVLAFAQDDLHWAPIVLALIGGWWLYCGIVGLFPSAYFRRQYPKDLSGKKYLAVVDGDGFEVTGDLYSWRVKWQGVSAKGENSDTVILYGANTIFMFGKKYLSTGQLEEFRRLAKI